MNIDILNNNIIDINDIDCTIVDLIGIISLIKSTDDEIHLNVKYKSGLYNVLVAVEYIDCIHIYKKHYTFIISNSTDKKWVIHNLYYLLL